MFARFIIAALAAGMLAACAPSHMAPNGPGRTSATELGQVLVDENGMTLYTFDPDHAGMSTCTGLCAEAWPPVVAAAAAQETDGFTIILRPNGSRQWAHDGMPLYTYAFDLAPGDIKGDGVDGEWHVARP